MLIKHLSTKDIDQEITLQGRIVHLRSSGKVAFIELRDGTGFIQCVVEPENV
ncbi:MAG: hypothetical protein GXP45_01285 [bacterium]|nr:hypothetical protein [bacterium]